MKPWHNLKTSRVAKIIEETFKKELQIDLTFGQIMDKFFIIGQSAQTVFDLLNEMTHNKLNVSIGGLKLAVKHAHQNELCNFKFAGKKAGNIYRKPGSGFHNSHFTRQTGNNNYHFQIECLHCHKKYMDTFLMESNLIGLITYKCKKCGQVACCKATIKNQTHEIQYVEGTKIPMEIVIK